MIKRVVNADLVQELEYIGFDKSYLHRGIDKFQYSNLKIYDLNIPQANILKQIALSVGADCAVHRETITAKIEHTDCLLGGSFSQLKKISAKLRMQPFGLSVIADEIEAELCIPKKRTKLAGVLNLTRNSFSDGGEFYEFDKATEHLEKMISDGADIIDIGAESTKPFSSPVSDEEQLEKLLPVLDYIKHKHITVPVSIDTRSSLVAKACIEMGASIINDVSGLEFDKDMAKIIAQSGVKVIIQHTKGSPENMQVSPEYSMVMDEIFQDLKRRCDYAIEKGIKKENIIVDAGIGFGKTREHNFQILKRISELKSLGYPIMLGLSRKSFLDMKDEANDIKDIFSTALSVTPLADGIDYLRVHNVHLHAVLRDLIDNFNY